MNVYDFDRTIYINDSSTDFFFYCLRKNPAAVVRTFPSIIVKAVQCFLGKCEMKDLKEINFSFLKYIPNIDPYVDKFWKERRQRIGKWYLAQAHEDDVIISASPEFLLEQVREILGVDIIGTRMDKKSGQIFGRNCHDTEKVTRFFEKYPDAKIEEFYSDSLSDAPMAQLADRAYIVCRGKIRKWK